MGRRYTTTNKQYINAAKETLKSFFGVYGDEDHMEYREGWERIPENWYRTPLDYGLIGLNLDIIDWVVKYPELAR